MGTEAMKGGSMSVICQAQLQGPQGPRLWMQLDAAGLVVVACLSVQYEVGRGEGVGRLRA